MFGFDPITIGVGALIWAAFRKQSESNLQRGVNTPERELIFKNAMEYAEAPRLLELAKMFERDGLKAQGYFLRKRAEWRSRPAELKKTHDEIFAKAMNSDKIEGILGVAKLFEEYTATIKAGQLRERAKSLNNLRLKKEAEAKATADPGQPSAAAGLKNGADTKSGTNGVMTSHTGQPPAAAVLEGGANGNPVAPNGARDGGLRSGTETS